MEVMDLCCASLNQKNQFSIFLIGKLGCGSSYLLLDVPCVALLFYVMIPIFGSRVTRVLMFLSILFIRTCLIALLRGATQLRRRENR